MFILISRLLLYPEGSGLGQSVSCFVCISCEIVVLSRQKLYVDMVVGISWLHSCLCV